VTLWTASRSIPRGELYLCRAGTAQSWEYNVGYHLNQDNLGMQGVLASYRSTNSKPVRQQYFKNHIARVVRIFNTTSHLLRISYGSATFFESIQRSVVSVDLHSLKSISYWKVPAFLYCPCGRHSTMLMGTKWIFLWPAHLHYRWAHLHYQSTHYITSRCTTSSSRSQHDRRSNASRQSLSNDRCLYNLAFNKYESYASSLLLSAH